MKFPNKLWCALACIGSLAIPASARALPEGLLYDVSIFHGQVPTPVGQIIFFLFTNSPFISCQYFYQWTDSASEPSLAEGLVDEPLTLAHRSCFDNRSVAFSTIVQLDSQSSSFGFDASQHFQQVFAMVLGETPQAVLSGTIQFTGAVSIVDGIDIRLAGSAPPAPPPPSLKPKPKH